MELFTWKLMLKSVVEQKMALAAYGSDGAIPVLSACQLDIIAIKSLMS